MFGSALKSASKQLYHLHLEGGHCQLVKSEPRLEQFIDYYWFLHIEDPAIELEVIPDTAIDLVLCPDVEQFAALYFPVSEKFSLSLQGPVNYTGICFHSATVSDLLGVEISSLRELNFGRDTIEQLELSNLISSLRDEAVTAQVDELNAFWLEWSKTFAGNTRKKTALSENELIGILQASIGSGSISSLCESLQISERQFRRLTRQTFGVSPKKMQNILRLQSALAELFACEPEQMQDLYYDDSHRIRELKRLTGLTPLQIYRMAEIYNNQQQS